MKVFAKSLFVAATVSIAVAFSGCASYVPLQGNNVSISNNVEVLGRVTVERETNKSGYTVLLEEALKKYPDADDIVNILVDGKKQFGKNRYVMSAVVVKYKN